MHYPRVLKALGTVLLLFSVTLLIPLLGSLYWDEGTEKSPVPNPFTGDYFRRTTTVFFATFLLTVLLGFFLVVLPRETLEDLRDRESFAIVGMIYLLMAVLGSVPFLLDGATRDPSAALFESMSGLTTTGATALDFPLEQYPPSILLWRSTLHYVGGMGIIVLSIAVLQRMTEGAYKLMAMETPGGAVTRIQPKITQTAKVLWSLYTVLIGLMFLVLAPLMRFTGRQLPWKQATFEALTTSMGALSTGGFHPHTDSIAFYGSTYITWVVVLFMLAGGVNFNLYWITTHGRRGALWQDNEFRTYLFLYLLGATAIAGTLYFNGRSAAAALEDAAFQSAAFMTTTGYTSTDHNAFPDLAKMVLLLLMFVGASTGSTAGGFKVIRIRLLFTLTIREVQKLLHPHAVSVVKVAGRILPDEAIRRTIVFFFSYITLFLAGALFYLLLGFSLVDGVSSSLSLLSNVGPAFGQAAYSYADVGALAHIGGFLLMWLGRLEIFTALLLFIPATWRD